MILKSPIFRKLLSSTFFLIALTILVLDFYLTHETARRQVESVQTRLSSQARLLSAECAAIPATQLQPWVLEAGRRAQARITIINPQGAVLADSEHDPETMENHANRPEIREAYQGRTGSVIRHSATLDRDLCYVAIPLAYREQPNFVLRLAVPLEDLDAAIRAVRWRILWASLVAAVVALGIAYLFSRSFTRRIDRIRAFAEGLADESTSGSLALEAGDELGALARSLNRTSVQLHELIDRLSLESSQRQAILSSMVEGVLAVDRELRVTFSNDSFARAVGVQPPIAARTLLLDLVRDPGLNEIVSRVLASGEALQQRLRFSTGSAADFRVFEVHAVPLASPSGQGALAILHDVTHLERLERVRKDFVANVSHELRTPLTAIRGYAETLLEGGLEDEENNRRFLKIIQANAARLSSIASDLLTLSELESGETAPEPERISVREAIEAALRVVAPEARVRSVKLASGRLDDAEVCGNRIHLGQVLVNLLDNGIKFNRPGGEVRVQCSLTADGRVCIVVADNGIGIPSEHLPRIFERFYRVDKARSREVGGTGLGLSIVKHIIERMNGTIAVESQLGKGSTFTVVLPSC